ncbi:zinc ribbon domain-containing protein [Mycolicibacterium neworleansense]|uniref:zinc ribbon domain-containing protein n=1 Tax=Mycolicibacterium neworleansense TaxID=146018 RepID=UPI0021F318A2|nr:zinc ribbon domain-containing protein [Mycolicibacterium neworleansense]MCV7365097.1 zinc ribbon domain-containing protein [Mycolicibacterium neworleansense]
MTAGTGDDPVPTMECRVCRTEVAAGAFCGRCGACRQSRRDRPEWLRIRAYCAGRNEHLLRPSVVSSLFPELPHASRAPFRVAVGVLAVAVAACTLLRLPAAMSALAALGLPLLFVAYLRKSAELQRLPVHTLLLTGALGAGLGAAWALTTGTAVAREYDMPMGADVPQFRIIRDGLGVPLGALVLMLIPVVVIRLLRPCTREVLDGFAIGALGGLAFTAAATLSRFAPQFDDGLVDHDRPLIGLLVQAGIQAVAVPLTAAATGAFVGIVLWFTPAVDHPRQHPEYTRTALVLTAAAIPACYVILGLMDLAPVSQMWVLTVHLAVMAAAMLAVRVGLQLALLYEAHTPVSAGESLLCSQCGQSVPDAPFCRNCGVAIRALSRSPYEIGDRRVLGAWGAGVTVLAAALVGVSAVLSTPPARYVCPPDCGRPPTTEPVATNPRFTAPDGAFSVAYPATGAAYTVTTADDGVTADFVAGDGGTMQLLGKPAAGRTPKEIATALVEGTYPDTDMDYEIPNAMVGYQPGYGMVLDSWPQNATGDYMRIRVVILAAVKNDLALIAVATGPYHAYGPDFGPGIPSGANLDLALDMGKYVNSFRWRGDPAR